MTAGEESRAETEVREQKCHPSLQKVSCFSLANFFARSLSTMNMLFV